MSSISPILVFLLLSLHQTLCCSAHDAATSFFSTIHAQTSSFSSCLASHGVSNFSLPASPSYNTLLNFSIRNLRFTLPNITRPAAVVLPGSKEDLQRAILCARNSTLAIRVRSGGHSYEGSSYTTENHVPFAVIDLMNLNRVQVDPVSATVWAETGATLGELYYAVGRSNRSLAFSGGSCSTIGLGGIISGGGFGLLSRMFGLASDNVLDAVLVDPNGTILDRSSMGEDIFWAIRGGGGGSWGVVYAWKLQLVPVPYNVTMFIVGRTGPVEYIVGLVHKWQYVGPNLPDEFYLSVYFPTGSSDGNVSVSFEGQVLGTKQHTLSVLSQSFPLLGVTESDLSEMSWVESTTKFANVDIVSDLLNRQPGTNSYSKSKSDYVKAPILRQDMVEIVQYMSSGPPGSIILDPYGGAMARVESGDTPFPHRAGILYGIQYGVYWDQSDQVQASEYIEWLQSFYMFMTPHVSKDPRGAYVNYMDMDLGANNWTNPTGGSSIEAVAHARSSWGAAYFGNNFDRLVRAKTTIDPGNVFNNAQSIPPLY